MKCAKCGTEFHEGIFCPECGTKYDEEEAKKAEALRAEEENKQRELELEKAKAEAERLAKEQAEQEAKKAEEESRTFNGVLYSTVEEKENERQKYETEQREIVEKKKLDNKALWSFILGIAVIPLTFTCVLWLPAFVISIIFGYEAIKKNSEKKTWAIAGLVFDGLFVALMLLGLVVSFMGEPSASTSSKKDNGTVVAEVSENESVNVTELESDEAGDEKAVTTTTTDQTTTTTTTTITTTTTTTTTVDENAEEEYLAYSSWAGDYGGGWNETALELQINNSATSDGLCGYITEYFRGGAAKYALYYKGDGCFYGKYIGGDYGGDNYLFYLKDNGKKTIDMYYEDGSYAVTFTKGAPMTDEMPSAPEVHGIDGEYQSLSLYDSDYGIDYYVVIEVSTNTDGSARYGMSARDINTDRIIQEEKGKMILQDDGSYESEDYDYTFKFTDDGVLIGYMWDYFSYFDAYCYYCDWN